MHHEKTRHAARGKWRGILLQLGLSGEYLSGKHGPCPICNDGQDRYRFDNKEQKGTWICSVCGSGDGLDLVQKVWGLSFVEACARVDPIVGNVKDDPAQRPALTDEQIKANILNLWRDTVEIKPGDLAHRYFVSRHIDEMIYPRALRFASAARDGEGGVRPCIIARVADVEDKGVTLHRTFLRADGLAKAEMQSPRKLMPGELPEGACIRLSNWTGSGAIGIAEGIETAMSASAMHDLPVWAAINAGNLAKWIPPEGAEEVVIFGDNDQKFAGQAAAYALARRLASKGLPVSVQIPTVPGTDWADEWMATRRKIRAI